MTAPLFSISSAGGRSAARSAGGTARRERTKTTTGNTERDIDGRISSHPEPEMNGRGDR
jgi:hypothetical protein